MGFNKFPLVVAIFINCSNVVCVINCRLHLSEPCIAAVWTPMRGAHTQVNTVVLYVITI